MELKLQTLLKTFSLCALCLTCVSCSNAYFSATKPETGPVVTKSFNLEPFTALVADGYANIELTNGPGKITATGTRKDLKQYFVSISKKVLYVQIPQLAAENTTIKISVPKLNTISVQNYAKVNLENFKTPNLQILAKAQGEFTAHNCQLGVSKIVQNSAGKIDINWIKGDTLVINSNSVGPIYLAGTTKQLVIKLTGQAMLDARYLRAEKAGVFVIDRATAHVLVTKSLGGFAADHSNIYYYKRPLKLTVATRGSGNVLHPAWIH